jgi:hypothetical protein
MKILSY